MSLPLSGVRVLDLSRVLAGPLSAMILGDLGAEVIKIERPGTGDDSRGWGPPFDSRGESAYFLSCNRNKLSVAADLNSDADCALVEMLVAGAHVVIENFRAGTLDARGVGAGAMLARHAGLVWCTISGFGLQSDRPGYDFVVQAESGWMAITGEVGGEPMKTGVALIDVLTGREAATNIVAALAGLARGVPVQRHLHVSLQHSAASALINVAQNALVTGVDAARWGNSHASLVPYDLFHAADRPLVIAVGNDAQFANLVEALALPVLADADFATNAGRVANRSTVVGVIAEWVRARPAAESMTKLQAAGVPCGLVRTVLEALSGVTGSPLWGVAPLAPGTVRRPPPRLDEHGAAVRANGWSAFTAGQGQRQPRSDIVT